MILLNFVSLRALRGQKFRALGGSSLLLLLATLLIAADAQPPANYQQDFQKSDDGSMPPELLVMNGAFAVKFEPDNKFLQLPGEPLDTFGRRERRGAFYYFDAGQFDLAGRNCTPFSRTMISGHTGDQCPAQRDMWSQMRE